MAAKFLADIVIIANKWWEVAPLVAVLQHTDASPNALLYVAGPLGGGPSPPLPRVTLTCGQRRVAVCCVQDLMDPAENPSLTWEKARVLERLRASYEPPRIMVALGTAAFPGEEARNGCVTVMSRYFVHDPFPDAGKPKHWCPPKP